MINLESENIYVHDGVFHADEVFCVAIFSIFINPNFNLIRTRSKREIDTAINSENSWAFDVGKIHNPEIKCFDHHQDDQPIAAIGRFMNYLQFGDGISYVKTYLGESSKYATNILQKIIEEITHSIDLMDTGTISLPFSIMTISKHISLYNHHDVYNSEIQQKQFLKAVGMVRELLILFIDTEVDKLRKGDYVKFLFNNQQDILVLDTFPLPWKEFALNNPEVLIENNFHFVVFPAGNGEWRLQSMPDPNDLTPFSIRTKITNVVEDISIFVHKGGFIAAFETKDIAITAARKLLKGKDD